MEIGEVVKGCFGGITTSWIVCKIDQKNNKVLLLAQYALFPLNCNYLYRDCNGCRRGLGRFDSTAGNSKRSKKQVFELLDKWLHAEPSKDGDLCLLNEKDYISADIRKVCQNCILHGTAQGGCMNHLLEDERTQKRVIWLLDSPFDSDEVNVVLPEGSVGTLGYDNTYIFVRPACWVDLCKL